MDYIADKMAKVVLIVGLFSAIAALGLGVYWLIWQLWIWVLPQIWVGGPESFTSPSFWPFAGLWFLMSLVFKTIKKK